MKILKCFLWACFIFLSMSMLVQQESLKAEINGKVFSQESSENTISLSALQDSVRINFKVYKNGIDASKDTYIFTYEVKLKRGEKTLYQMNFKKGREYVFFTYTAIKMLQSGDKIIFKASNFTTEDEAGVHTQMLPAEMRELTVTVVE